MTINEVSERGGRPRFVRDVRYGSDVFVKVRDGMPAIPVLHFNPDKPASCKVLMLPYAHCDN